MQAKLNLARIGTASFTADLLAAFNGHGNRAAGAEPTTEHVAQSRLEQIVYLKKQIADLQAELQRVEAVVQALLESSHAIEPGLLTARIKTFTRKNIPWRQICSIEKGEQFCQAISDAAEPQTYKSLVVEAADGGR